MNIVLFQKIFADAIFDIFLFPIWWYSKGLSRLTAYLFAALQMANIKLAPGLWLKNLFVPMFGQTDWQGRLMSVFMRIANVFFRGIVLFFYMVLLLSMMICWVFLPISIGVLFSLSLFAQ